MPRDRGNGWRREGDRVLGIFFGPVGAVLLSAALLYAGNGLQGLLLPLRGVEEGFPTTVLGLMGSAYSLGFMVGCLLCPRVIRRVGHIRAFAVFAALAGSAALIHALAVYPTVWLLLRVTSGAALAGMFMVIESWLNEKADNASRGRILGVYMVVNYACVTAGQMLSAAGEPGGFALFAVAGIAIGWALIPVGLTTAVSPAPVGEVRLRLRHLYRMSPVGAAGALLTGIANGAFGALGAVFVAGLGFTTFETALFVSAAIAGAALMQLPAGALSDRMDRRTVIGGLAAVAGGIGLWIALSDASGLATVAADWLGVPLPFAWAFAALVFGAATYPLYGLCIAHMNDFVSPDGFVEAAGGTLLLWSIGAVLGPFAAGLGMGLAGPSALFLATAAAHFSLAGFALWRMTQRAAPATEDKGAFVPVGLNRMTPESIALDPRSPPLEETPEPGAGEAAAEDGEAEPGRAP